MPRTAPEQSYWTRTGRYQDDMTRLFAEVPRDGKRAIRIGIELIRCINNIAYDIFNNGGCNLMLQSMAEQVTTLGRWEKDIKAKMDNPKNWSRIMSPIHRMIIVSRVPDDDDDTFGLPEKWNDNALEDIMNGVVLVALDELKKEAA